MDATPEMLHSGTRGPAGCQHMVGAADPHSCAHPRTPHSHGAGSPVTYTLMGGSRHWWLLSSHCNEKEEGSEHGPGTSILTGSGVAIGAQGGLVSPGSKQHPPPHSRPRGPTPYLGVSASEPRSSALCTSPVRLAICFSIASIRSLPWARERGWLRRWLGHRGHPQPCPGHPPLGPCVSQERHRGGSSAAVTATPIPFTPSCL